MPLGPVFGVKEQGDRPVIAGLHLHIRAELPVLHSKATLPAAGHEVLVQRDGLVRLCRAGEPGALGQSARWTETP